MKMEGPFEVEVKVYLTGTSAVGPEGEECKATAVATLGMGAGHVPTGEELREQVRVFEKEDMPEGFRLMDKCEFFGHMLAERIGEIHALAFAVPGGPDWDPAPPEPMNEEARALLLQGRVEQQDRELATLREMERTYTNRLGELARLADKVAPYVLGLQTTFPPLDVARAAADLMEYVETVRPPEAQEPNVVPFYLQGAESFMTVEGEAAAHAHDGDWLQPTTNPFGHGCCACGLYHDVAWRLVDRDGHEIPLDELNSIYEVKVPYAPIALQLQFTTNKGETERLRAHQGAKGGATSFACIECGATDPDDLDHRTHTKGGK